MTNSKRQKGWYQITNQFDSLSYEWYVDYQLISTNPDEENLPDFTYWIE